MQDDGGRFGGIAWLLAIVVSLVPGHGADGGIVFGVAVANGR